MSLKLKILVVDDTPKNIQLVANVLHKLDKYEIIFALNGNDAIQRVEENDISLILLDIMMPEMDGYEVASILKNNKLYMDIPIIFITAFTDTQSITKGFELGAADYITKPFNPVELVSRVNTHIELFENRISMKNKLANNTLLLEQYKKVVDESDIVSKTDLKGNITYINKQFEEISGYSLNELIGKPHNTVRHNDMPKSSFQDMWSTLKSKNVWHGKVKNRKKDGGYYIVESTVMPIVDKDNTIVEYISVRHDITDIYKLNKEIEDTQKEVIFTLGSIGESRSKETGNHVKRVAEYSYILAKLYGLDIDKCKLLKSASPMHDIGKVAIPDAILNKPGKLTSDEFEIMKTHSKLGHEMLNHSSREIMKTAAIVAHEHHERWDGNGYPQGLQNTEINIYGRITALVDVFDALSSDRCYKKAWELDSVLEFIQNESGKYFEPKLVDLFLNNIEQFISIKVLYNDDIT